jgi:hypothetical protein
VAKIKMHAAQNGAQLSATTMISDLPILDAAISLQKLTYVPSDFYDNILRYVDYDEATGGIPCDSNLDFSIFINKNDQFTLKSEQYVGEVCFFNLAVIRIFRASEITAVNF